MRACAECRQAIYGSVSIDALADGLNARTLREAGKRKIRRHRPFDCFDLMRDTAHGLPPSVQAAKWACLPDMGGCEIMVLALRQHHLGHLEIGRRVGQTKGNVGNFLKRLCLPTYLAEAEQRARREFVPVNKRSEEQVWNEKMQAIASAAAKKAFSAFCKEQKKIKRLVNFEQTGFKTLPDERRRWAEKARETWHRRKHEPVFNLTRAIRTRVYNVLRLGQQMKRGRTHDLVGCDGATLRAHIEAQFKPGMTWCNRSEWHIDHIKPIASFDLSTLEGQKAAFHYTNLQPLWADDNRRKNSKFDGWTYRRNRRRHPLPARDYQGSTDQASARGIRPETKSHLE